MMTEHFLNGFKKFEYFKFKWIFDSWSQLIQSWNLLDQMLNREIMWSLDDIALQVNPAFVTEYFIILSIITLSTGNIFKTFSGYFQYGLICSSLFEDMHWENKRHINQKYIFIESLKLATTVIVVSLSIKNRRLVNVVMLNHLQN